MTDKWVEKNNSVAALFLFILSFESSVKLYTEPLDDEQGGMWLTGFTSHKEELLLIPQTGKSCCI